MAGLSVRLTPVGRAEVIVPEDQTPILDVVQDARSVLVLTPRRLDEVSYEELEAARSLLTALTVFVEHCQRWTPPVAERATRAPEPRTSTVRIGGAA